MTSPIGEPEEISIDTILNDPILKERVLQFCAKQYSEENILFIDQFLTIRSLELSSDEKIIDQQRSDIFSMFDKFFSEYAPLELNIPVKEKKDLLER